MWVRLVVDGQHKPGVPLVNRNGHVTFAEDCEFYLGDSAANGEKDTWLRECLEARGYLIHSWRPREGPAGSVYAYKRGD